MKYFIFAALLSLSSYSFAEDDGSHEDDQVVSEKVEDKDDKDHGKCGGSAKCFDRYEHKKKKCYKKLEAIKDADKLEGSELDFINKCIQEKGEHRRHGHRNNGGGKRSLEGAIVHICLVKLKEAQKDDNFKLQVLSCIDELKAFKPSPLK